MTIGSSHPVGRSINLIANIKRAVIRGGNIHIVIVSVRRHSLNVFVLVFFIAYQIDKLFLLKSL